MIVGKIILAAACIVLLYIGISGMVEESFEHEGYQEE